MSGDVSDKTCFGMVFGILLLCVIGIAVITADQNNRTPQEVARETESQNRQSAADYAATPEGQCAQRGGKWIVVSQNALIGETWGCAK